MANILLQNTLQRKGQLGVTVNFIDAPMVSSSWGWSSHVSNKLLYMT